MFSPQTKALLSLPQSDHLLNKVSVRRFGRLLVQLLHSHLPEPARVQGKKQTLMPFNQTKRGGCERPPESSQHVFLLQRSPS